MQLIRKKLTQIKNTRSTYSDAADGEEPRKWRGDTIVEVLICIAIVGAVISGAYSLAGNSLQQGISASDHTQAIKIAEGQLEALKYRQKEVTTAAAWLPFAGAKNFCLNINASGPPDSNWAPQENSFNPGHPATTLKRKGTPPFGYAANCINTGTGGDKYFINISRTDPPTDPTNPTYLITVRWTPPGEGPTSQTSLYYRF